MPVGPLEATKIRVVLEQHGLIESLPPPPEPGQELDPEQEEWEKRFEPSFAEKLRMYFGVVRPEVDDVTVTPCWAAGELLASYNGNFNLYVSARDLTKQEGIIFRHCLRLILMCEEFAANTPPDTTEEEWLGFLRDLAARLTASCRAIDPSSTEQTIKRCTPPTRRGSRPGRRCCRRWRHQPRRSRRRTRPTTSGRG